MSDNGTLTVDANENGSRLDRLLVRRLGSGQRSLILRLIRKGNVRINRKRCKPEARVSEGDLIFLPVSLRGEAPEPESGAISPALLQRASSLEVLYEDASLLVINKPAGVVVHGGSGHEAGLIEALKVVRGLPDLRLAHRLDRDTSGVLLMAKDLKTLRALTEDFRERDMQKTYFALIAGHPYAHAGRMHSTLAKGVVRGGERMVVDSEDGKEAITDYQVMLHLQQRDFNYAMIALHPHSGRTHQLRVQMMHEGHAILGDGKYGEKSDQTAYRDIGGRGLMLHAWRLRFTHPQNGREMEFRADWPASWKTLLQPAYASC